jgi:hypothetical protein
MSFINIFRSEINIQNSPNAKIDNAQGGEDSHNKGGSRNPIETTPPVKQKWQNTVWGQLIIGLIGGLIILMITPYVNHCVEEQQYTKQISITDIPEGSNGGKDVGAKPGEKQVEVSENDSNKIKPPVIKTPQPPATINIKPEIDTLRVNVNKTRNAFDGNISIAIETIYMTPNFRIVGKVISDCGSKYLNSNGITEIGNYSIQIINYERDYVEFKITKK